MVEEIWEVKLESSEFRADRAWTVDVRNRRIFYFIRIFFSVLGFK